MVLSEVVDGKGVPLGITVDAANRHDMKMTKTTLQRIVVSRPEPTTRAKQHMCMDKGYDYPEVYELMTRSTTWMNRFRRLMIRWEKKVENHIAMFHFACTCITYRAAGLFG